MTNEYDSFSYIWRSFLDFSEYSTKVNSVAYTIGLFVTYPAFVSKWIKQGILFKVSKNSVTVQIFLGTEQEEKEAFDC